MNDSEDVSVVSTASAVMYSKTKKKQKKKTKPYQNRYTELFNNRKTYCGRDVLNDLKLNQTLQFSNFCWVSSSDFEKFINIIGPKVGKRDFGTQKAIPVEKRLAVTLSFLATGDTYSTLAHFFKISKPSISAIIPEVCEALIESLQEYVKVNIYNLHKVDKMY